MPKPLMVVTTTDGELRAHVVAREAEAREVAGVLALDHHVGPGDEVEELGAAGVVVGDADGALVGVEVLVPLGMQPLGIARWDASTFTTSAPRSAKTLPQYEPAGSVASSRTATSLSS